MKFLSFTLLLVVTSLIVGVSPGIAQECLKVTRKGKVKLAPLNKKGSCGKRGVLLSEIVSKSGVSVSGSVGPEGPAGQQGPKGDTGAQGIQGPPGPFLQTLPSGETLTGRILINGHATGSGQVDGTAISFPVKLPSIPVIRSSGNSSECPGSFDMPLAAPGVLCLYQETLANVAFLFPNAQNEYGLNITLTSNSSGGYAYQASWAVTAP